MKNQYQSCVDSHWFTNGLHKLMNIMINERLTLIVLFFQSFESHRVTSREKTAEIYCVFAISVMENDGTTCRRDP